LAETKELDLSVRAFPREWMVYGDYEMLLRVLINLLGNAIKFTSRFGKVIVFIQHHAGNYLCGIRDTGEGIRHEELDLIFEKFAQGRPQNPKRHGGSGLGLSICRGIIEAHQGKIWAESEGPGKGSTFFFSIPCYQPQEAREDTNSYIKREFSF
jgi:signal transduction histidine kinase